MDNQLDKKAIRNKENFRQLLERIYMTEIVRKGYQKTQNKKKTLITIVEWTRREELVDETIKSV